MKEVDSKGVVERERLLRILYSNVDDRKEERIVENGGIGSELGVDLGNQNCIVEFVEFRLPNILDDHVLGFPVLQYSY